MAGEYLEMAGRYVDLVPGDDAWTALEEQTRGGFWAGITEQQAAHRYAPGKWSLRESFQHVIDTERVFAFRLLWIARGHGHLPLPGFDQEGFAAAVQAESRSWASLLEEFAAVRQASLSLLRSLTAEDLAREGQASGHRLTARAAAFLIPGHERYHIDLAKQRYLAE
jgi:hypothetical protein